MSKTQDEIIDDLMLAPIWSVVQNAEDVERRRAAIKAALEAEREACAKVAESQIISDDDTSCKAIEVADAIRARSASQADSARVK